MEEDTIETRQVIKLHVMPWWQKIFVSMLGDKFVWMSDNFTVETRQLFGRQYVMKIERWEKDNG